MSLIFDFFFEPYADYNAYHIFLEIVAVCFGLLSVLFSKQNNIWVYPTGMVSTVLFVYLLAIWGLIGDMLINMYYFIMSIYGWYIWARKVDDEQATPITFTSRKEHIISIVIFGCALLFVFIVYQIFNKWTDWTAYVDTITTGVFFVGMWLMAKRKVENWLYWIFGNLISVPLYFYKGFTFTSFQYLIFTFIAIFGYFAWKKSLVKSPQMLLR